MIVYRIEDANKEGPYRGENGVISDYYDPLRHPLPWHDTFLMESFEKVLGYSLNVEEAYDEFPEELFCGFKDFDQFSNWFYNHDILDKLEWHGFKISIYESEEVILGSSQVLFDPYSDTCEFLNAIDIAEFFERNGRSFK